MAAPQSLINGVKSDQVSIHDRGFLYGQNVFETIAVKNTKALLLDQHLQRLHKGCQALSIAYNQRLLKREITQLLQSNNKDNKASNKQSSKKGNKYYVLRVCISAGIGGRGYLTPARSKSQRILTLHDYPKNIDLYQKSGITLGIAKLRLSEQPSLAGLKHANRLEQVLARSEWQENWQEALLLNPADDVIEATQSNVFIVKNNTIYTPDLSKNGVAGIMRQQILDCCAQLGIKTKIMPLSLDDVRKADAIFLSNSLIGIWPVKRFGRRVFKSFDLAHQLLNSLQDYDAVPHF